MKSVGQVFRDHPLGPLLTVIPPGTFLMGGADETGGETPIHAVEFRHPFAMGVYPVTFDEWDLCYGEAGTSYRPSDRPLYPDYGQKEWGRGRRPVINVCWNDAWEYCRWLSRVTGQECRLPSEAEWEYAARGGTTSAFAFGDDIKGQGLANCKDCAHAVPLNMTSPVGLFPPNDFGLFDVHGNVWEWVQDSMNSYTTSGYNGAPLDGTAWEDSSQAFKIMRGGSWNDFSVSCKACTRKWSTAGYRYNGGTIGFRVARDLTAKEMGISLVSLARPISRRDLIEHESALDNLQGGIIKPHGRDYGTFLICKLEDVNLGKECLRQIGRIVTTHCDQKRQALEYKGTGNSNSFVTLHMTAEGYRFLKLNTEDFSEAFANGMNSRQQLLGDPDPESLESTFNSCHFGILIADSTPEKLNKATKNVLKLLKKFSVSIHVESSLFHKRDQHGQTVEHFGYADGISNPVFLPDDRNAPVDQWNDIAPFSLALVHDPLVDDESAFGSYTVIRKIAQFPDIFEEITNEIASRLREIGKNPVSADLVGSLLVGRHKDGTPLALIDRPIGKFDGLNNFGFNGDIDGIRCPYFSHIRKVNPRGQHGGSEDRSRRIIRRGMLYDSRLNTNGEGKGVFFVCHQASIEDQFEFIQAVWANDATFQYGRLPGPDPLIGNIRLPRDGEPYPPYPAASWNGYRFPAHSIQAAEFKIPPITKLLGGEYFFTPSKKFLLDCF